MDLFALRAWFEREKRDLPWRRDASPYRVWISEVMLQQTQVAVVIPFFERWMHRFPTIEELARAPIEVVIKMWEGLGYYSRARNLHRGAHYLVSHHRGSLPNSREELEKIQGLGPYTIGAILSFAFHQKAAAIDGNVVRVLTRLFFIEEEVSKNHTKKRLEELMESLLPDREPWIIMEGLIELGARICQKEPKCSLCPIKHSCLAFSTGKATSLPNKRQKAKSILLRRHVVVIGYRGELLIRKEERGKVMADLYEFPYFETEKDLQAEIEARFSLRATLHKALAPIKHSFTRFRVELFPTLWVAPLKKEIEHYEWRTLEEALSLPFSAGHRRLLKELQK